MNHFFYLIKNDKMNEINVYLFRCRISTPNIGVASPKTQRAQPKILHSECGAALAFYQAFI